MIDYKMKKNNKQREKKRKISRIWILCLMIIFSFFVTTSCYQQNNYTYISKVIDGDTFQDNNDIKYRLLGIDTPESFDSSHNFHPTIGIQKFYASKATDLSSKIILNKKVILKIWKLDFYNRVITKINYQTFDLALELLKNGLARVKYISPIDSNFFYYPDIEYYNQLSKIEIHAKINKVGIWNLSLEQQKSVFPK